MGTGKSDMIGLGHRSSLIFENDKLGGEAAKNFVETGLIPLIQDDLQQFTSMVRLVPNFLALCIESRRVLDIAQQQKEDVGRASCAERSVEETATRSTNRAMTSI